MGPETFARALRSAPTPKRIRAFAKGAWIADSERARIVWTGPVARTYAFPVADLRGRPGKERGTFDDPIAGPMPSAPLEIEGARVEDALLLPPAGADLEGHAILNWNAMEAWFEEDEQVFVHPHDPGHRIDARASGRHLVVEVDGVRLAQTRRPVLLFETGLPVRYYVPSIDVRLDLLEESGTRTACAYKGFATHYHARVGERRVEDVAWSYPASFLEAEPVRGMVAFYQERTDVTLDGAGMERPRTPWHRAR